MISMEEYTVIHTLRRQGHSIRAIARITKLDRRTVSKRLKEGEFKPYKKRVYSSKLDTYKSYIDKRLKEALPHRIPSTVILDEISQRGYKGKIRIIQNYLSKWYEAHYDLKKEEQIYRFETEPGFQAQVDWTNIRSGKRPIYGFVMILGYSRAPFVYFTDSMRQEIWQECHERAFAYFEGIPKTILYDNLKSAIIERDRYGKNRHGFNQSFLDFSKGRFVPKFCKPYRAQTKGKVERFNRYLKENFYIPLKASLQGSGIEITPDVLNTHIFRWIQKSNQRVHATTQEKPQVRFEEEKKYLQPCFPLPVRPKNKERKKDVIVPKIDITYYTTLNAYEEIIAGVNNAY